MSDEERWITHIWQHICSTKKYDVNVDLADSESAILSHLQAHAIPVHYTYAVPYDHGLKITNFFLSTSMEDKSTMS